MVSVLLSYHCRGQIHARGIHKPAYQLDCSCLSLQFLFGFRRRSDSMSTHMAPICDEWEKQGLYVSKYGL